MSLNNVPSGKNLPDDFNVIIEIPMHGEPVKYEVDKESGAIFVDRFMNTAMHYPCNYGYIPHTLCGDGDPVDVLVVTPVPLQTGVVVRCRPLGVLKMEDEGGQDAKFFAHYKDLEPNKWVKIDGWYGVDEARAEIMDSVANYQNATDKPAF
jgi:inorganic pyrophosphatase